MERSHAAAARIALLALAASFSVAAQEPLKIGFSMTLTGALGANGRAALLAMQMWAEDVNKNGGLLGRPVKFVYYDDQTNPANVPGLYNKLLDVDKVDLIVSSYGTNVIAPAIPVAMQRKMAFMTLFGTNPNGRFNYDRYFQIMPNGPEPAVGLTKGFFEVAMTMDPKPKTVALVGADAEYPHAALDGARTNVKAAGLKVVYDKTYPTTTTDFTPIVRAIQATNPEVVFVASYPPDSAGMVRAANEVALKTRQFGGAMIGVQYANLKTQLGPLLNGVVAWEVYAPEPTIKFPGVEEFLSRYQPLAAAQQLDPLGFFLPPYAYAMMQIVGEAVQRVGKIDQAKIAEDIHSHEFSTVVGNVRFAKNGEWAEGRPLYVQYRGIQGNGLDEWKKPGHEIVLWPKQWKSGELLYPFDQHRK
jgi:branched-chain amino acid transport system substrate-binding protein